MARNLLITVSAAKVLDRMAKGDLPTLKGGFTNKSVFEDGAVASHATMTRLHRDGKIAPPEKASVHSPWTLTSTGRP